MSFIYDLSTPTTINFQHLITDPTGHRTHQLAVANATRSAMRAALKQSQPNSADNPDHYKATKVIEDYLPHLLGLMDSVEKDTLLMTHQIVFGWRSTLSSRRVRSAPRISLPTLSSSLFLIDSHAHHQAITNWPRSSSTSALPSQIPPTPFSNPSDPTSTAPKPIDVLGMRN